MDAVDKLLSIVPQYAGKQFLRVPFQYVAQFTSLAFGASQVNQVQFQADADFVLLAQTFYAFTANAPTVSTSPYPNVSVLQNDSGSGKNLSNVAYPLVHAFGNGQFPFYLPQPYIWSRNAVMSNTLTNNDGATAYTISLVFHGIKLQEIR